MLKDVFLEIFNYLSLLYDNFNNDYITENHDKHVSLLRNVKHKADDYTCEVLGSLKTGINLS